jgi:hypothetical protein
VKLLAFQKHRRYRKESTSGITDELIQASVGPSVKLPLVFSSTATSGLSLVEIRGHDVGSALDMKVFPRCQGVQGRMDYAPAVTALH